MSYSRINWSQISPPSRDNPAGTGANGGDTGGFSTAARCFFAMANYFKADPRNSFSFCAEAVSALDPTVLLNPPEWLKTKDLSFDPVVVDVRGRRGVYVR